MQTHRTLALFFGISLILLTMTDLAQAQATRTWVSGVGDDVNPCSRTAPCKTYAGAISKTAAGGEINCLDPGGFGSVMITKSMTIDCTGTQGSIIGSGNNGFTINAASAVVRLRGLNLNGASTGLNGINILAASSVSIENTIIDGFTVGVFSADGGAQVFVSNVTLRNNGTGLSAGAGTTIHLLGDRIFGNKVGLAAKGSGSIISYKNNLIVGNGTNGAPTSTVNLQ